MGLKGNKICIENRQVNFILVFLLVYIMGSFLDIKAQGAGKKIEFRTHIIDDSLLGGSFSNTGLADLQE
jgi:hypothetical protein